MTLARVVPVSVVLLALLAGGAGAVSAAAPPDDLSVVLGHYEPIRQALLVDKTEGVSKNAAAIEKAVRSLSAGLTAQRAGVPAARLADVKALLPQVAASAAKLAAAKDLRAARTAFGEMSRPLIQWRDMASGSRPVVAYCSMLGKFWIQPRGEIGNPYHGQEMPRCGEIVTRP